MSTYLAAILIKENRHEIVPLAHDYFTGRYFIYSTTQVILIRDRATIGYLAGRYKFAIWTHACAKIYLTRFLKHINRGLYALKTKDFLDYMTRDIRDVKAAKCMRFTFTTAAIWPTRSCHPTFWKCAGIQEQVPGRISRQGCG